MNKADKANQRDQLIFGEPYCASKYPGRIRRFDRLTLDKLDELVRLELLDPNSTQNNSPSAGEFIEFLSSRKSPGWSAHGYCTSIDRPDFRVSIEGIEKEGRPSYDDLLVFANAFRWADDFGADENGLYCWYD